MDGLDVRILRSLGVTRFFGHEPRPMGSLRASAIAKAVKVSPERAKHRIARLERDGIIAGYEIYPNFRHLGLEAACYYYDFGDDDLADQALEQVKPLEGTFGAYAFTEGVLCAALAYRSPADLERKLRLLVALAGQGELRKFYDVAMPRVGRPLSHLDWRIVRALRGDPLRPLPVVAKELKVSARTVKRRVDRMGQEGSFFVVPRFDPSRVEGLLLFYLIAFFHPDAEPGVSKALTKAFDAHLVTSDVPDDLALGSFVMLLAAHSMAEVQDLRRKAAKVKGVAKVRPYFFRSMVEKFDWIDEAIEERIKATS
jgi:DNA-binding Lrp family transcriptional regulator